MIIIVCITKRWKNKDQFSLPELCNFFTFYKDIGVEAYYLPYL